MIILLLLGWVDGAAACTCISDSSQTAWPTLDQASRDSPAVLVGRVVAQNTVIDPPAYKGPKLANLDIEVVEAVKGPPRGARIRVWDGGFGSSCSVDLRRLPVGAFVVLALARYEPEHREYYELMRLKVGTDDYVVRACGDYMLVVSTEREGSEVAARLRKAVTALSHGPQNNAMNLTNRGVPGLKERRASGEPEHG